MTKRTTAARYAARQGAPSATATKKPRKEDAECIVLPPLGTAWPLAKPDGQSKGTCYMDPHRKRTLFQRSMGLHQHDTGDWVRLVTDKSFLQIATLALMSQFKNNKRVLMAHEVHLHFTCFDAPQANNLELLAHLPTFGLEFSQQPQWKPNSKVKKIIASVPAMTDLLWDYLLNAAICKDDIAMAIEMDKHGKETLTAADIPNKVQRLLRDKNIHVKIQPRESEHSYRALLINGMVEL